MPIQQLQHGHGVSITPNDNAYIWQQLFYTYKVYTTLYVGGAGDLHVLTAGGDDITFTSVPAGSFLPVHVAKVFASGTTATGIIALDITTQPTEFTGLLDTYSGAAAAYSLRQLSSSYSGSAIRVRRSSDNAEQDIGFASNELDTAALTSFCSGTNGYVTTWYDQSGNGNDATQTTAANQPKIYDSVSGVIEENGKAGVDFDGSDDYLFANQLDFDNEFIVSTTKSVLSGRMLNARYNGNNVVMITSGRYRRDTNDLSFNGPYYDVKINQQTLLSGLSQTTLYQDGALITDFNSQAYSLGNTDGVFIGIRADFSNEWEGVLQELILYTSDQSSNRSGIETNINDFYSIY